jgi:Na+-transporting methylmalonyl-CoA/oxaloacetate decarboxylase gamma subunit
MFRSAKALAALVVVLVVLFTTFAGALADKSSDVLDLVNSERKAAGLKTVKLNDDLNRVAELRAAEIAEKWSHTRPNGEAWKTAFADEGVSASYRGENLAKGQYSADKVVEDWMDSEGHRDNILNKKFTKMGVASVVIDGVTYWVQVFANDVKSSKKTSSNNTANASQESQGTVTASASAPSRKTAKASSSSSNQTGALDKLSNSVDVQAALNAPAASPTVGKNPGL